MTTARARADVRRGPGAGARLPFAIPLLAACLLSGAAAAHDGRVRGAASGLTIPALTHGQMVVIDGARAAIMALAESQARTDPTFRRLSNFIGLQHAACLWGLVPGTVRDEASPFNECAHADLAAVRALLFHMMDMPDARVAAGSLKARIDREMPHGTAAGELCRHSAEPFNTADVIVPRWGEMPFHAPSLAAFAGLGAVLAGGAGMLAAALRHRPGGGS